ncbi:energy-coupling factor transporter transmembrane component T family protein [Paenibacillus thalictri]|uniref:Energy-coupling factor transporter transmembrane protein EcfT n=1 Tax=Paenibacillus thalictri TaxID=2527873 RepID=A0A4Q9DXD3_9BACL|nr:energy-coupling factor transporter transmembrane component T [Paenibacillus thalictri]TBL81784.1 energy-coupling factor transporter transmembrane protein EcfT [Paenibacillus thalictri]
MLPSYRKTWMHRVNPSLKLLLSLALFLFVLLVDDINALLFFTAACLLLLVFFSGYPLLKLLLVASPFILLFVSSSVSMMFFGKGETVWLEWGLVRISQESFVRGLAVGFKSVDFSAVGLLFALTTRPVDLFYSLMQQLKLPPKYAYSFMAAANLIPMTVSEYRTLRQALKVRGVRYRRGAAGIYDRLRRYAVPLLAQSIRRAQRIAVAMEAKRFSSAKERTYYYELGFSASDVFYALCWLAAAAAAVYAGGAVPVIS